MKLEHFLTPYTKINCKWLKYLNGRPETIKLLEENRGSTSKILYEPPLRVMEMKKVINKLDKIKLKRFCIKKETLSKVKKPTEQLTKN